jgi:carboxylesterase
MARLTCDDAAMPVLPGAEPFAADGGPVGALLCHGFTGSPQSLRPWAEHLAAEGLTVELPRLPGHGTSWREMNLTRWEDWYATVDRALRGLTQRCDQVFVMGLSMGGTLALRLAEQRGGDVSGLVLVNPSLLTTRLARHALPVARHLVPALAGVAGDIKRPGVTELAYDRVPLKAAYSLSRLWLDTRANLDRVTQPVLLFRSAVDHVVEPDSCALLNRAVSGEVREVVLHDSYHVATLDNDAPAIFAGSVEFVRRLSHVA